MDWVVCVVVELRKKKQSFLVMVSAFLYKMMLLFAVLLDVAGAGAYSILRRSFISHHREICFLISNAQVIFLVKKKVF